MGLSWQQGPLGRDPDGTFVTATPTPERMLYLEPLRRRMSVQLGGSIVARSDDVVLEFEPARYPVAYFPLRDIAEGALQPIDRRTTHPDVGDTRWFAYHRIDIRRSSRHLVVRDGDHVVADTHAPLVLYESGFAPRWYVPRADVVDHALHPVEGQTFCRYKGLASYYDVGEARSAAWSYRAPFEDVSRIADLVSFYPEKLTVTIDDEKLGPVPGQDVVGRATATAAQARA